MPGSLDILTTTKIMQYAIGALMALLPACIWGYIFYKKSPENRKTVLISFVAGALSVIPMFVWQHSWKFSFDFLGIKIPHLNIYDYVRTLSSHPSLENFISFTAIVLAVSLVIYVAAAIIIFCADLLFGTSIKTAYKNVFRRSLEEPLIFVSTGLMIALLVVLISGPLSFFFGSDTAYRFVLGSFWTAIMIGFLEEYSKHLVVRFADDEAIYSVDSAIEFSVLVALGFASFENILYFVDKLWLSPCTGVEIANNECLFNAGTGLYMHQVGVLLLPFVFRSLLSTLAHLVFSGIFGYFYGVAHFASYELQAAEKRRWGMFFWEGLHKLFRMKTTVLFHEMKILQGLVFAMVFHGLFDFALDQEKTFITVPMIFGGYMYLSYLFQKKENQKKLRLLVDTRTSRRQMEAAIGNVELLEKFETRYLQKKIQANQHEKLSEVEKHVAVLEAYEKMLKKKKKE